MSVYESIMKGLTEAIDYQQVRNLFIKVVDLFHKIS